MGTLTATITGRFLAFDSSPLIYYIEQHPQYSPLTDDLFDAIHRGDARGMTSVLTPEIIGGESQLVSENAFRPVGAVYLPTWLPRA